MINKITKLPIKQKSYFDIKVEVLAPILLSYRIYATDEEEALELIKKSHPNHMKPNLSMKKLLKATVYTAGSTMVKLIKRYK